MSVADMLAAARAGSADGLVPAKAQAEMSAAKPQAETAPAQETAAKVETVVEPAAPAAKTDDKVDKSKMTIDDKLAWCRQHDGK